MKVIQIKLCIVVAFFILSLISSVILYVSISDKEGPLDFSVSASVIPLIVGLFYLLENLKKIKISSKDGGPFLATTLFVGVMLCLVMILYFSDI